MIAKIKYSVSKLPKLHRGLLLASLSLVLLIASLFVYLLPANASDPTYVGTENELTDAVNTALSKVVF
jgi:energy-converting hydrogenase Eha subunit B